MVTLNYEDLPEEARTLARRLANAYLEGDLEWQFKIILTLRGDDVGSVWLFGSRRRDLLHARDIPALKQLLTYRLLEIEMDEKRSMYVSLTKPLFSAVENDFQAAQDAADKPAGDAFTTGEFRQALAVTVFGTAGALKTLLEEHRLLTPELARLLNTLRDDPSEDNAAQVLPELFRQVGATSVEQAGAGAALHGLYQLLTGML